LFNIKKYPHRIMAESKLFSSSMIDQKKWDALVSLAGGPLYSTYHYLSLCEGSWEALILEYNHQYVCAMPIPYRVKAGMKFIYQSPMACYLSPLTSPNEAITKNFLQSFQAYLQTFRYAPKFFLKYDSNLHAQNFQQAEHHGLFINLQHSYAEIAQHYSKHRTIRLKQTLKSNQQVICSTDVDTFFQLHEIHTVPRIGSLSPDQRVRMNTLWKKLVDLQQAEIYFSQINGNPIAATLIGKFGTTLYSLASTSTEEGRKQNGMTLLTDHVIKTYASSSFTTFDLGTRAIPAIDDFKISFGAKNYSIHQLYRNQLPWYLAAPKKILNLLGIGVQ
jgi:hypothetical protein